MVSSKKIRTLCALCGFIVQTGCSEISANLSAQDKFGSDYAYFAALKALDASDEGEAARLFKQGAKNAEGLVRRKCVEELTRLGIVPERIQAARTLVAEWKDDAAFLRAAQELFSVREYREIITLTDAYTGSDSELMRLRISALAEKNDSRLAKEASAWLNNYAVSESQREFIKTYDFPAGTDENTKLLFSARESVFLRRYDEAYKNLFDIPQVQENPSAYFSRLSVAALSDVGKIFLYSGGEYIKNALMLDNAAEKMKSEKQNAFYPHFYAGRLYDRSGAQNELIALDRFKKAMDEASDADEADAGTLYDNALWYYLSSAQKISIDEVTGALEQFGKTFRNKSYYDDFFDTLALALFNSGQWNAFYSLARIVVNVASGQSRSKYAYLAGRLSQTKLASISSNVDDWFRIALLPGGDAYYMFLASRALKISSEELAQAVFSAPDSEGASKKADNSASRLLLGYAEFGFPERVYSGWAAYRDFVDAQTVIKLSEFLQNCADDTLKIQGLRMISRVVMNGGVFDDQESAARAFKLTYPKFFNQKIESVCAEFSLPAPYMFALVRSESFFDAGVLSYAGARGLTQLMNPTAADIARKLKIADYDLFDADINLRFGAFYFAELLARLDGNVLAAYFAYNAGISRVRNWLNAANNLPSDIFIEAIPFNETRAYGKNIVTALCFYGWLHYDTPVNETLDAVFK